MKIAYETHPVTPERKAELRQQGFKIIDARFKPDDAGHGQGQGAGDEDDPSVDELRARLSEKGIEYGPRLQAPGLLKLLEQAEHLESVRAQLADKGVEFAPDAALEDLLKLLEGAQ